MCKYDDIIDHPHHQSKIRNHMSQRDRAAQFAPFAALTGYEDSVREAARLTDDKIDLGEAQTEAVNLRLNFLAEHLRDTPYVVITYFKPDEKKEGGVYLMVEGNIKKVDGYGHRIVLSDNCTIQFDYILDIQCDLFPEYWE